MGTLPSTNSLYLRISVLDLTSVPQLVSPMLLHNGPISWILMKQSPNDSRIPWVPHPRATGPSAHLRTYSSIFISAQQSGSFVIQQLRPELVRRSVLNFLSSEMSVWCGSVSTACGSARGEARVACKQASAAKIAAVLKGIMVAL